MTYYTALECNN